MTQERRTGTIEDIKKEFIDRYPKNYAGDLELGGCACSFSLNKVLDILDKFDIPKEEKEPVMVWEQWCEELKSCGPEIVNKRLIFCNSGLYDKECTNVGNGKKCPLYGIRCIDYKEADEYLESKIGGKE